MSPLFTPVQIGRYTLPNRLVMAPMTRSRADDNGVPSDLVVTYYAQRASAGLIITEGVFPSAMGKGYVRTPGIATDEQIAVWKKVTEAVHAKGGRIFMQIMHSGRISHPSMLPNQAQPVAPSAIKAAGQTRCRMEELLPPQRPWTTGVINGTVRQASLLMRFDAQQPLVICLSNSCRQASARINTVVRGESCPLRSRTAMVAEVAWSRTGRFRGEVLTIMMSVRCTQWLINRDLTTARCAVWRQGRLPRLAAPALQRCLPDGWRPRSNRC
jgi:hypothetical protein